MTCWSRLYELQIPAGSGRGAGPQEGGAPDRKRVSGECQARWDPRPQVGAPRALCGRGPFSVRGSAPGPCTRFFTVGSPT